MFITDVNDTGEKLFSGVNDTGEKFIAGCDCLDCLKGVWHEIFDLSFFSWISVPQAPKYSIGAVLNFF